MKKILVGCPTYEGYNYCLKEYAEQANSLTYTNYDVTLADNSPGKDYAETIKKHGLGVIKGPYSDNVYKRIVESRNLLRQKAIDEDYDYFLSLEQDVIPPKDIIERLMKHGKDIVTGIYYKVYELNVKDKHRKISRKKTILPVVFTLSNEEGKMNMCYPKEVEGDKFLNIRACGLGCVLISRKVLEKIAFRYEEGKNTFDDFLFCTDAIEQGFEIYADTSAKCKHLFLKKGNVFKL